MLGQYANEMTDLKRTEFINVELRNPKVPAKIGKQRARFLKLLDKL